MGNRSPFNLAIFIVCDGFNRSRSRKKLITFDFSKFEK